MDSEQEAQPQQEKSNWEIFRAELDTKQTTVNPTMNIINFYKILFSEVSSINLNMEEVLDEYKEETNKIKPSDNSSERVRDIYQYLTDIDPEEVQELAQNISVMGNQNLFDTIQNIEKLYMKLMIEYNHELQRSHSLGLFKKENLKNGDEDNIEQLS